MTGPVAVMPPDPVRAIHESGHAIASLMFGHLNRGYVTIVADEKSGGHCRNDTIDPVLLVGPHNLEREPRVAHAIRLFAGPFAQRRRYRTLDWLFHGASDFESASRLLRPLHDGSRLEFVRVERSVEWVTCRMLGRVWQSVLALGDALVQQRTLDRQAIWQIVDPVWPEDADRKTHDELRRLCERLSLPDSVTPPTGNKT